MKESKNTDNNLYSLNKRGDVVLNHLSIVKMLKAKYHTFSYKSNVYVYQDGIYIRGKDILESEISNIAMEAGVKGSIIRNAHTIMRCLRTVNAVSVYPFNTYKNVIPIEEGVVLVNHDNESFKLCPHDPKYTFDYKIDMVFREFDIINSHQTNVKRNVECGINDPEMYNMHNQFERILVTTWIKHNLVKTCRIVRHYTSYNIKHMFEHSTWGFYMTNGSFKGAMLECGFDKHTDGLNWCFAVSNKCLDGLMGDENRRRSL